nr:hypothetical protein GCM10020185_68050 [Pseudomonas brassicacearum subsp. brassicacearum]
MIDVVPPAKPAAVPLKKSSLATVPMNGNCMCVWGVDAAGHQVLAAAIEHFDAGRNIQVFHQWP